MGKSGTVCGLVASTEYEPEHPYTITILNIDKAEDPDFFIYFWHTPLRIGHWPDKADRSIDLSTWFNGKKVCVEGRIEHYRDTPAINANYWHQYEVTDELRPPPMPEQQRKPTATPTTTANSLATWPLNMAAWHVGISKLDQVLADEDWGNAPISQPAPSAWPTTLTAA